MPADVNDNDITQDGISQPSSVPTQMSVMMFKVRLFRISTQICHHISGPSRLEVEPLNEFDAIIAEEQQRWDSTYLVDVTPIGAFYKPMHINFTFFCIAPFAILSLHASLQHLERGV
ncbi:hypothetical protein N7453_001004 [Penicillium expansum]|nr:hypothetical protein N7453_001004 [Penicillium expansum]